MHWEGRGGGGALLKFQHICNKRLKYFEIPKVKIMFDVSKVYQHIFGNG